MPPYIFAYSWHPGVLFIDTYNYHWQTGEPEAGGVTQALAGYKITSPEELLEIARGYNRVYRTAYQGRREVCEGWEYTQMMAQGDFTQATLYDYYKTRPQATNPL